MSHRVTSVEVLNPSRVLRLFYEDGSVRDIDLVKESKRGGVWQQLLDAQYVQGVKPIWDGFLLEFPDGVTWSVEVCWIEGTPVETTSPVDAVTVS